MTGSGRRNVRTVASRTLQREGFSPSRPYSGRPIVIETRRRLGCLALATALVVVGTLATGVLPSTTTQQALAGVAIVAGFGLAFYCLGALETPEP